MNHPIPAVVACLAMLAAGCDSANVVDDAPLIDPVERFKLNVELAASHSADNLLTNPFFEDPITRRSGGWSACESLRNLNSKLDPTTRTNYLEVDAGDCVLQAVNVTPGKKYALSCDLYADNTDKWSGLGLSFYDDNGALLFEPKAATVKPTALSDSKRKTVSGIAPDGTSAAMAWFYTDTGGRVDNCWLREVPRSQRVYRKTASLEKCRTRTRIGGSDCVRLNGFDEYQRYAYFSTVDSAIDGFHVPDALYRKFPLALTVTDEHLYVNVSFYKANPRPRPPLKPEQIVYEDSFPVNGQLWNDDSFEIYLNVGNEKSTGYDDNDFLRIYGIASESSYQPIVVTGDNSRFNLTHEAECSWVGLRGGTACDVRFSLDELGLTGKSIAEIGFDVHVNVDDDGGDREAKYSWCSGKTLTAYEDMSKVKCSVTIIQQPEIPHPFPEPS